MAPSALRETLPSTTPRGTSSDWPGARLFRYAVADCPKTSPFATANTKPTALNPCAPPASCRHRRLLQPRVFSGYPLHGESVPHLCDVFIVVRRHRRGPARERHAPIVRKDASALPLAGRKPPEQYQHFLTPPPE